VHLGEPSDGRLFAAEGIETGLSVMQIRDDGRPAWAAMSAPNLANLIVPDAIIDVVIAGDDDKAGRDAVDKLSRRLLRQPNRRLTTEFPIQANDFNDDLMRGVRG
jgi:hypothetical protein